MRCRSSAVFLALATAAATWHDALRDRLARSIGTETVELDPARMAEFVPPHTVCVRDASARAVDGAAARGRAPPPPRPGESAAWLESLAAECDARGHARRSARSHAHIARPQPRPRRAPAATHGN